MKTEVVMKRELLGQTIRQRSKSEHLSGTDLLAIANKWRSDNGMAKFNMPMWLKTSSTEAFIEELQKESDDPVVIVGRGRNGGTWLHPLLFIDMALAIHPKLKVEMYSWIKDSLLIDRKSSGISYKLMSGALHDNHQNTASFGRYIKGVARKIQRYCGVGEGPDVWQTASIEQLKERDRVQLLIAKVAESTGDNELAMSVAFHELKAQADLVIE